MTMMIHINLLPVRQVKKRELGKQVIVLFAAVLVLAVILNGYWYANRAGERDRKQAAVADSEKRIKELEKAIGEVNNIAKRKKEVEDKLKVLDELRKGRSGPVRMLDALATATPKKVSLSEFSEKAKTVSLTGVALSHDDVAELMRSLSTIVWTPKGLGRLVEQRRDTKASRVELLAAGGAIEDFPMSDLGVFFSNIDLKKAEAEKAASASAVSKVKFEIQMSANYAI